MFKSFLFSLIATMLIFSIMAPSIEVLLFSASDSAMVIDINEEESNKKENEKKFGEKDLFYEDMGLLPKFQKNLLRLGQRRYICFHTNIPQEIVSPPPEHVV